MVTANRGIGLRTSAAAAGAPFWQVLRGVTAPVPTPLITNISVTLATAVQTELLLIKTATVGTPTSTVFANQLYDPGTGDTDNTRFCVAWNVAPTIGAVTTALAKITLPAVLGATVEWNFEEGELQIEAGQSLVLWNAGSGAGAALDVSCFFHGN